MSSLFNDIIKTSGCIVFSNFLLLLPLLFLSPTKRLPFVYTFILYSCKLAATVLSAPQRCNSVNKRGSISCFESLFFRGNFKF